MGKYIDAEHLKELLNNKYKEFTERSKDFCFMQYQFMADGLNIAEQIVDSLQQEQPDCHTVEDWIQHIKNADQLTKDIFSKGPYDVLYDALNHPYQHCYDAIKEFGELCFQTGVNSVKQKQQEVDCEKEYTEFVVSDPVYSKLVNDIVGKSIARHFYELGLNARKED